MINIGGNIGELHVGSTPIGQAYIGSQLVWEKNVPTVEDADGNVYKIKKYVDIQYGVKECSIGLYPNLPVDGFESKIGFANNARQYVMGGGYANAGARTFGIMTVSGILRIYYNGKTLNTGYNIKNKTVVVSAIPDTNSSMLVASIDGVALSSYAFQGPNTASKAFYIGRFYNMTDYGSVNGNKIYYFKYWRNGSLVRDMIPVEDENGVYALFDKIELKAYYSSGSSNFTGG